MALIISWASVEKYWKLISMNSNMLHELARDDPDTFNDLVYFLKQLRLTLTCLMDKAKLVKNPNHPYYPLIRYVWEICEHIYWSLVRIYGHAHMYENVHMYCNCENKKECDGKISLLEEQFEEYLEQCREQCRKQEPKLSQLSNVSNLDDQTKQDIRNLLSCFGIRYDVV